MKAEHTLTIEDRLQDLHGPGREDVAYEATVRLANAISSKYAHYKKHYGSLAHVRGKPHALYPVSMLNFQLNGLAQIYGKGQSVVADFPHGYLLERTCLTAIPS